MSCYCNTQNTPFLSHNILKVEGIEKCLSWFFIYFYDNCRERIIPFQGINFVTFHFSSSSISWIVRKEILPFSFLFALSTIFRSMRASDVDKWFSQQRWCRKNTNLSPHFSLSFNSNLIIFTYNFVIIKQLFVDYVERKIFLLLNLWCCFTESRLVILSKVVIIKISCEKKTNYWTAGVFCLHCHKKFLMI